METLLIYGEENSGKTTTCQKIIDWLNANSWNQMTHEKLENPADNWFNDFKAKGCFNNKVIAIYSPGDEKEHLREAISFAQTNPCCDILIATVRKGIHYSQPLTTVSNSPLNTIEWFTLKSGTTISEKNRHEDELVRQIVNKF